MRANLPADLSDLNDLRNRGEFPWSVVTHAIAPAFEGRLLGDLTSDNLEDLFVASTVTGAIGPDHGFARELATETPSNQSGEVVSLGQYLYSALLAPGQRTLGPTKIFGGMHEIAVPDVYTDRNAIQHHLIPLELRSHGPERVSWDKLWADLLELIAESIRMLPTYPDEEVIDNPASGIGEPETKRQRTDK